MSDPILRLLGAATLVACTTLAALSLPALADPTPARKRLDPADAAVAVPRATYESSLEHYRRHAAARAEQPLGAWPRANETVSRIGGWRAYAREAAAPDAAPGAAPSAATGSATVAAPGAAPPRPAASAPTNPPPIAPVQSGPAGHKH